MITDSVCGSWQLSLLYGVAAPLIASMVFHKLTCGIFDPTDPQSCFNTGPTPPAPYKSEVIVEHIL